MSCTRKLLVACAFALMIVICEVDVMDPCDPANHRTLTDRRRSPSYEADDTKEILICDRYTINEGTLVRGKGVGGGGLWKGGGQPYYFNVEEQFSLLKMLDDSFFTIHILSMAKHVT